MKKIKPVVAELESGNDITVECEGEKHYVVKQDVYSYVSEYTGLDFEDAELTLVDTIQQLELDKKKVVKALYVSKNKIVVELS